MFASGQPRAFTCLRCQFRLAHLRDPRSLLVARPRRLLSVSTSLADNGQNATWHDSQDVWSPPDRWERTFKALQSRGKSRGRARRDVEKKTITLPMNRLGVPADVLVIHGAEGDLSQANDHQEQNEITKEEAKLTSADIVAAIEEENRDASPAAIVRQIDSLRPSLSEDGAKDAYIPRSEFDRLFHLLVNGYTFSQLQLYVERKARAVDSQEDRLMPKFKKDEESDRSVFTFSEWRPEIVPIDGHFPRRWMWYTRSGGTRKERIAWYLMRKYWQLKIIEEPEPVGQVQLRTIASTFDLLAGGCK